MTTPSVTVVTPPAVEPVTLADMDAQMRIVADDEAALVEMYVKTARLLFEQETNTRLITTTLEIALDAFPSSWLLTDPQGATITLPDPPLQSVVSIKYIDTAGTLQTLDAADYQVDARTRPGRIRPAKGKTWPSTQAETVNAVVIQFKAGHGDVAADVPADIRAAISMIAAHLFENREATTMLTLHDLPLGPRRIMEYRRFVGAV